MRAHTHTATHLLAELSAAEVQLEEFYGQAPNFGGNGHAALLDENLSLPA